MIYSGFPIKVAAKEEIREAVIFGEQFYRAAGMSFYKYGDKIFVVSDEDVKSAALTPRAE